MSTPNFGCCNSSKYYAFGKSRYFTAEDVEANDWDEDMIGEYDNDGTQMDYEWAIENCQEVLKKSGWDDADETDDDRYRTGHIFAEKSVDVFMGNSNCITVTIQAVARSGYYEGANFDYNISFKLDYYTEYDELPDELDVIRDEWFANPGMCRMQSKNAIKRLEAEAEKLINEAEAAFAASCEDELICLGVMSNGEAIYEKVA